MKYNNYTIEDFLTDREFIDWARGGNSEQAYFFDKWLATDPVNKRDAQLAREILIGMEEKSLSPLPEEYHEVLTNTLQFRSNNHIRDRSLVTPVWRWAAVIAVIAIGTFALKKYTGHTSDPVVAKADYVIRATPKGQRAELVLPDGSKMILNAESEVRYASDFGIHARQLELKGEAFFEVKHNARIPFIVKSGNLYTQALGTSFNIEVFDNAAISIALMSGRILVTDTHQNKEKGMVLEQGEKLVSTRGAIKKEKFDYADIAWKDDVIIFQNSSLTEVISTLERWYGVNIMIINRPDAHWRYTGTFEKTTLQRVMERMSYTENFEFVIAGDSVELRF
jgi:transmembrane sensor